MLNVVSESSLVPDQERCRGDSADQSPEAHQQTFLMARYAQRNCLPRRLNRTTLTIGETITPFADTIRTVLIG